MMALLKTLLQCCGTNLQLRALGLGAALQWVGKFYVQGWVLLLGVLLPIRRIARLCKRAAVAGAL